MSQMSTGALQGTTNLGDFKDPRSRCCHMSHPMTTAVTQQRPSMCFTCASKLRFIQEPKWLGKRQGHRCLLRSCEHLRAARKFLPRPPPWSPRRTHRSVHLFGAPRWKSTWVSMGLSGSFDPATSSEETRELPGPRNGFGAHINRHPARSHSEGLRG